MKHDQISFFECENTTIDKYIIKEFSFDSLYPDEERRTLEKKYSSRLEILEDINRQSVSFQLSKNERVHSWLKYREGFSASLVEYLIEGMNLNKNDIILDPFFGSGTTGLVSQMKRYDSVGFDILPTSKIAIEAKASVFDYNIGEIEELINELNALNISDDYVGKLNSFTITEGAYPEVTEYQLAFLTEWIGKNSFSNSVNKLLNLCILNCLETLSYTRKDGQYLRWDYRSEKVKEAKSRRTVQGKEPIRTILNKGELPEAIPTILAELRCIKADIEFIQKNHECQSNSIDFRQESVLTELPRFKDNTFGGVITSPPYCNRYDYTRTYALELAFLGLEDDELKRLRQTLISCTVENKSKEGSLREYYKSINQSKRFEYINSIINSNKVFQEIIKTLEDRGAHGDLNNKGIITMIKGYFYELGFIYAEIYRTCKPGAKVYFVNDNVRYGGEVIPVDYLSSEFAESFGFEVNKIYCIKQQKGNSSQQMKKFGRVPLRKSITEWTVCK